MKGDKDTKTDDIQVDPKRCSQHPKSTRTLDGVRHTIRPSRRPSISRYTWALQQTCGLKPGIS